MKKTFALLCLIFIISPLFSQEVLVMTKKKNGKEKIIEQGDKIRVWTNSDDTYKGNFTLKGDSLIIDGNSIVSIDSVRMISKKSTGVKIAGGVLSGLGGFATAALSIATMQILAEGGIGKIVLIIIIPMEVVAVAVTVTGIMMLTIGKKYKNTKWDYSIQ